MRLSPFGSRWVRNGSEAVYELVNYWVSELNQKSGSLSALVQNDLLQKFKVLLLDTTGYCALLGDTESDWNVKREAWSNSKPKHENMQGKFLNEIVPNGEIVPQIVPSPNFTKDFDFEIVPESSQGR